MAPVVSLSDVPLAVLAPDREEEAQLDAIEAAEEAAWEAANLRRLPQEDERTQDAPGRLTRQTSLATLIQAAEREQHENAALAGPAMDRIEEEEEAEASGAEASRAEGDERSNDKELAAPATLDAEPALPAKPAEATAPSVLRAVHYPHTAAARVQKIFRKRGADRKMKKTRAAGAPADAEGSGDAEEEPPPARGFKTMAQLRAEAVVARREREGLPPPPVPTSPPLPPMRAPSGLPAVMRTKGPDPPSPTTKRAPLSGRPFTQAHETSSPQAQSNSARDGASRRARGGAARGGRTSHTPAGLSTGLPHAGTSGQPSHQLGGSLSQPLPAPEHRLEGSPSQPLPPPPSSSPMNLGGTNTHSQSLPAPRLSGAGDGAAANLDAGTISIGAGAGIVGTGAIRADDGASSQPARVDSTIAASCAPGSGGGAHAAPPAHDVNPAAAISPWAVPHPHEAQAHLDAEGDPRPWFLRCLPVPATGAVPTGSSFPMQEPGHRPPLVRGVAEARREISELKQELLAAPLVALPLGMGAAMAPAGGGGGKPAPGPPPVSPLSLMDTGVGLASDVQLLSATLNQMHAQFEFMLGRVEVLATRVGGLESQLASLQRSGASATAGAGWARAGAGAYGANRLAPSFLAGLFSKRSNRDTMPFSDRISLADTAMTGTTAAAHHAAAVLTGA